MGIKFLLFSIIAVSTIIFSNVYADQSVQITMNQIMYSFGEKLSYIVNVSEVTGESAIIHIRDDLGKESSAIPIEISELETVITSPFPFEKEIFPVGKYYVDIDYSGSRDTVEFNVIDTGKIVLPFWMKQIAYSWLNEQISDGALMDAIQKGTDDDKLGIADKIDRNNLDLIYIPKWVKITTTWWLEDKISDNDLINLIQYLIKVKTIMI